jgi:hypothetical protein
MVCNPSSGDVYIATGNLAVGSSQNRLFIISGESIVSNLTTGVGCNTVNYCNYVDQMFFNPFDQDLYLVYAYNTYLSVTVVKGTSITNDVVSWSGVGAGCLAMDSSDGDVYVGSTYSYQVAVLRDGAQISSVPTQLGNCPMLYDQSNGLVYAGTGPSITALRGTSIVGKVTLAGFLFGPDSLQADGSLVYAEGVDRLSVVEGLSVIAQLNFSQGSLMGEMAVNPTNGFVYLQQSFPNSLTSVINVISRTDLVANISSGLGEYGSEFAMGVDTANGFTYAFSAPQFNGTGVENNYLLVLSGRNIIVNQTLPSLVVISTAEGSGEFYALVQPEGWLYNDFLPLGENLVVLSNSSVQANLSLIVYPPVSI